MPVLESIDKLAPKSVLRHRPVADGKQVLTAPVVQRASRPHPTPADDEIVEWKRETGQIKTEPTPMGKRGTTSIAPKNLSRAPSSKTRPGKRVLVRAHPLLYIGLGMLAMLMLWVAFGMVFGWVHTVLDDLHYGMPRTMQVDAYVGHEAGKTPSHFIAENLRGRVLIIELPGGDAQKARIFLGPQLWGPGADHIPVTLSFVDRNNTHHPDMLVQFGGTEAWYVNEHGTFVPQ